MTKPKTVETVEGLFEREVEIQELWTDFVLDKLDTFERGEGRLATGGLYVVARALVLLNNIPPEVLGSFDERAQALVKRWKERGVERVEGVLGTIPDSELS